MNIVITIPAYNEEKTLGLVIKEINETMMSSRYRNLYKILVFDDGSIDNTASIAQSLGAIVVAHKRNMGLAQTFIDEIQQCLRLNADIIVHTDADGQYPAVFIPKLIETIEQGYDLVLGSRFKGKIEKMPIIKRLGNIAFAHVFTALIKQKITDSTTGFRAFTKEVAQSVSFINRFTYTQEQLLKAAKQKFKIKEIPIFARKTRKSRLMKGPIDYAVKAWLNIFRIYRDYDPLKFFGKVGIFFFTLGLILGLYILFLSMTEGIANHLGLIVLDILLISLGVQIILFGFLADMLNTNR